MDQVKFSSKLHDKRVLIIGGTSGIGFGVAEAAVESGAHVYLSSSSSARVGNAVERLQRLYPSANDRIKGHVCNLGQGDQLADEINNLLSNSTKEGRLDHVVFTAGEAITVKPLQDFTLPETQQAGMTRFFAPLMLAQQLPNFMIPSTRSSLTLTTGSLAQRPRAGWTVMTSYLTGLQGMTRALAKELAPIRVNLVGPGPTDTERWNSHDETADVDALKRALGSGTLTKSIGNVVDVAEAYLYFMKDANVTGSVVHTNGGALLV